MHSVRNSPPAISSTATDLVQSVQQQESSNFLSRSNSPPAISPTEILLQHSIQHQQSYTNQWTSTILHQSVQQQQSFSSHSIRVLISHTCSVTSAPCYCSFTIISLVFWPLCLPVRIHFCLFSLFKLPVQWKSLPTCIYCIPQVTQVVTAWSKSTCLERIEHFLRYNQEKILWIMDVFCVTIFSGWISINATDIVFQVDIKLNSARKMDGMNCLWIGVSYNLLVFLKFHL